MRFDEIALVKNGDILEDAFTGRTYRVVETGRHSIKAKGETIVNGRPIKDEITINRSNYYNFIVK